MAFTQTCKDGLVPYRMHRSGDRILVAGDPGVTFTKNLNYRMVNTAGVAVAITDSDANGFLRCCKTKTCAAATVAFPTSSAAIREWDDSADVDTLISMECMLPDQQIFAAKLYGYQDETALTSYTASTRTIVAVTGHGANDRSNGALIYVYSGPGAGEVNIAEDYVHTTLSLVTHRAFSTTLTAASAYIIMAAAADANTVGPGSTMDPYDSDSLHVLDGYDDGDWMVYPSWRDIIALLPTGALPVVRRLSHE